MNLSEMTRPPHRQTEARLGPMAIQTPAIITSQMAPAPSSAYQTRLDRPKLNRAHTWP